MYFFLKASINTVGKKILYRMTLSNKWFQSKVCWRGESISLSTTSDSFCILNWGLRSWTEILQTSLMGHLQQNHPGVEPRNLYCSQPPRDWVVKKLTCGNYFCKPRDSIYSLLQELCVIFYSWCPGAKPQRVQASNQKALPMPALQI